MEKQIDIDNINRTIRLNPKEKELNLCLKMLEGEMDILCEDIKYLESLSEDIEYLEDKRTDSMIRTAEDAAHIEELKEEILYLNKELQRQDSLLEFKDDELLRLNIEKELIQDANSFQSSRVVSKKYLTAKSHEISALKNEISDLKKQVTSQPSLVLEASEKMIEIQRRILQRDTRLEDSEALVEKLTNDLKQERLACKRTYIANNP